MLLAYANSIGFLKCCILTILYTMNLINLIFVFHFCQMCCQTFISLSEFDQRPNQQCQNCDDQKIGNHVSI